MASVYYVSFGEVEVGYPEFKAILGYLVSSEPV